MRIQHNIMAMSAYRNYTNNVSAMKKNLERLSSGYKINRAGDDAAGLAISEKMRAQITGLETAQKNAKDGISLVQTAEGALTEVHDMLNRMVELATQSANGTYDNDTDRYQLQKEMDQLRAEIDRIADSSNFNGIMLLDGSMDAGGDLKYTAGSFQFLAEHPAGIPDSNITLKPVGSTLGVDTVLHTDGTKGGDTNAFSIDLHNLTVNAGGSVDVKIGTNLTVTVQNLSTTDSINAKSIVDAISKGGTKDIGITFKNSDGDEIELKDSTVTNGAYTVTLGDDSVFEMKATGTRLTFTQIEGGNIKMPTDVSVEASAPMDITWDPANHITVKSDGQSSEAELEINLSALEVDKAGVLAIKLNGTTFKVTITEDAFKAAADGTADGTKKVGQYVATELAKLLKEKAGVFSDPKAGKFQVSGDPADGKITLKASQTQMDADNKTALGALEIEISDAASAGEYVADTTARRTEVTDGTLDVSSLTGTAFDWTTGTKFQINTNYKANDVITLKIGEDEYKLAITMDGTVGTTGADAAVNSNDVKDKSASEVLAEFEKALNKLVEAKNADKAKAAAGNDNAEYKAISNVKLTGAGSGKINVTYTEDTMKYETGAATFSGDYNKSTTVLETKSTGTADRLASTFFDLEKLADAEGHIAEGTTITIGRDTYTFTYDKNKIGKDGYVVLNGGENYDTLPTIAEKLTKAAEKNGTYTVGHDGTRITITENEGQTNFDLTTMAGIERSLGFKIASTNPTDSSKGLTLQIGDTAESYNQLKVNIKDCHTKALGLDMISIANQADAADAVNSIKAAINYVSDVRGTLGATQNRLDHTINNLSVMTENIQDAESTVRDVDIAEEMMAYTKNNILIQSAQAMLAQANQVPQGVLQLLQ